jgi:hypothetical protein
MPNASSVVLTIIFKSPLINEEIAQTVSAYSPHIAEFFSFDFPVLTKLYRRIFRTLQKAAHSFDV